MTGHRLHPGFKSLLESTEGSLKGKTTWFADHPKADADTGLVKLTELRKSELEKRQRKMSDIFTAMREIELTQEQVRLHQEHQMSSDQTVLRRSIVREACSIEHGDDGFVFPSVDGSELLTRWDMQETPPDILITNVSMLSAMLNREVDAPIT